MITALLCATYLFLLAVTLGPAVRNIRRNRRAGTPLGTSDCLAVLFVIVGLVVFVMFMIKPIRIHRLPEVVNSLAALYLILGCPILGSVLTLRMFDLLGIHDTTVHGKGCVSRIAIFIGIAVGVLLAQSLLNHFGLLM